MGKTTSSESLTPRQAFLLALQCEEGVGEGLGDDNLAIIGHHADLISNLEALECHEEVPWEVD